MRGGNRRNDEQTTDDPCGDGPRVGLVAGLCSFRLDAFNGALMILTLVEFGEFALLALYCPLPDVGKFRFLTNARRTPAFGMLAFEAAFSGSVRITT